LSLDSYQQTFNEDWAGQWLWYEKFGSVWRGCTDREQ